MGRLFGVNHETGESTGKEAPVSPTQKPKGLKGAVNFLRNFPTTVARGLVVTPGEAVARAGATIGTAAAKISPLKPLLKKVVSPELSQKAEGVKTGLEKPVTLPTQTEPLFKPRTPFKSIKEAVGAFGEAALDLGTTITTGGLGSVGAQAFKGTAKEVSKETIKTGFKNLATKEFVKKAGKTALADAVLGGTYGATSALQADEPSAKSVLSQAASGAVVAPFVAPVLGSAIKTLTKGAGLVTKGADVTAGKLASKLEARADKPISEVGNRFFAEATSRPSVIDKLAATTAKGIRYAQQAPGLLKQRLLQKYEPVRELKALADMEGIKSDDLEELVQGASSRAAGKAINAKEKFLSIKEQAPELWQPANELERYLDAEDRLKLGNQIEGGKTMEDVAKAVKELEISLGPEGWDKVRDIVKQKQELIRQELVADKAAGLIDDELFDTLIKTHPNYLPHYLLDYEELAKSPFAKPSAFNVTKSGIERAVGSKREVMGPDEALMEFLIKRNLKRERNLATSAVIDTSQALGKEIGHQTLRTEANVRARKDYSENLLKLKSDIQRLQTTLKSLGPKAKAQKEKVAKLIKDSKAKEDEFLFALQALEGEDQIEFEKFKRELNNLALREGAGANQFADFEVEEAYKDFVRLASRKKDIESLNSEALFNAFTKSKTANKVSLSSKLYESLQAAVSYGKRGEEEVLEMFKKRLASERSLPKVQKGFVRKFEAREKKVGKLKTQADAAEGAVSEGVATVSDFKADIDTLSRAIEDLENNRGDVLQNLKLLRDIKTKPADYEKLGLEKISRFKNGVREDHLIPVEVGRALKHLDPEQAGAMMSFLQNTLLGKYLTLSARGLKAVTTKYNPVFAAFTNPVRDIFAAIQRGKADPIDFVKGFSRMITGKEDPELIKAARASGAFQANIYTELQKTAKELAQDFSKHNPISVVTAPVRLIPAVGQKLEEFTRLVVFKRALKDGASLQEAAKITRNATVDFTKSGSAIQVANMVIPFLNARVQGFANLASDIRDKPIGLTRRTMWLAAAPASLLYAYNSQYESYNNIPEYEKEKYFIIMVGQDGITPHYVKIPKAEGILPVASVVERALSAGKIKYPTETKAWLASLAKNITPVSESSILPTGVQYPVELGTNYSFFQDKPIEPNYIFRKGRFKTPEELREEGGNENVYGDNTAEAAKWLGKALNWSPEKIDYVIRTGVLNDLMKGIDLAVKGFDPEKKTPFKKATQLPFVRSVIGASDFGTALRKKASDKK